MRITAPQSLQFVWYFEPLRKIENPDVESLGGTAHPHFHSKVSAYKAACTQFTNLFRVTRGEIKRTTSTRTLCNSRLHSTLVINLDFKRSVVRQ